MVDVLAGREPSASGDGAAPLLEVGGLRKVFGRTIALADGNLTVPSGRSAYVSTSSAIRSRSTAVGSSNCSRGGLIERLRHQVGEHERWDDQRPRPRCSNAARAA